MPGESIMLKSSFSTLKYSFYVCVALLTLGQFSSVFKSGDGNLYLFDLALFCFSFIGFVYFLIGKKLFKIPSLANFFVLFSISALLSFLISAPKYSAENLMSGGFYLFRFLSYFLASLVVFNMLKNKMITFEEIRSTFIFSGIFVVLAGFAQLFLLPDFETLDPSLGWDPHKNRLASTFFDPNFAGTYLSICLALIMDKFFSVKKGVKSVDVILFLILLTALILTFSRSAWAMFGVIILIYGLFRAKYLIPLFFVISFLIYFAVPRIQTRISGITDPSDSASLRLISWTNAYKISKDNLLFGVGFNFYRYVQKEYGFLDADTAGIHSGSGADSSLLFILATTGVGGLIFYLGGLIFAILNNLLKDKEVFLSAIIFGLLVNCQFINSLFYPQIMFVLFILMFSYSFSRI